MCSQVKNLLKALPDNENFTFSSGELNMLIPLLMFVDLESDPFVDSLNASLSLLKTIVGWLWESPKTVADSLLGKPSNLFMVVASLCFQLKLKMCRSRFNKNNEARVEEGNQNNDATDEDIVTQNIVFAVSDLHSSIGQSDHEYWSSLGNDDQAEFLETSKASKPF